MVDAATNRALLNYCITNAVHVVILKMREEKEASLSEIVESEATHVSLIWPNWPGTREEESSESLMTFDETEWRLLSPSTR